MTFEHAYLSENNTATHQKFSHVFNK